MYKIQILNNISKTGLSRLPQAHYSFGEDVAAPDAILLRSADLHKATIADSVKAIGRAGAGTNNIPVDQMSARGVAVFNAPGANANAVKELVIAGMLISARNLDDALRFSHSLSADADLHKKVEAEKKRFVGTELHGRTLGVIGLGAIGVRVANAGRAMGMKVIGFDPHMTVEGAWQLSSEVIKAGSLNELYAACDYISFHVPLLDATRGLFSEASLEVARKGVVLLNFAREGIVSVAALEAGFASGVISRYVCDFPIVELLGNAKVISLPHLGASTGEAEENCAMMVVDQVRDYLENGNIRNSVNFPQIRMHRAGQARICIANRNVPNMIGKLTHEVGAAGLNILQMHNASHRDLAYNLIDVETSAPESLLAALQKIEGILSVRVI